MKENRVFPKVPDYHKPNKPLVSNGFGIIFVLASVVYLFLLYCFDLVEVNAPNSASPVLTLAVCILFGGFMGLLDDWMDLRWRYKAFLPILVALPLAAFREGQSRMSTYILGKVDFGIYFYIAIIPIILAVVTNTVNQLGGLNGLETICPSIVLFGLLLGSDPQFHILLYIPLLVNIILAYFNFRGKIFVGNTGSFALGITLASFVLVANIEQTLVISIVPYILNSSLILMNYFLFRTRAHISVDGKKLVSDHRRSLITLLAYRRPLSEHQIVSMISLLVAASTATAVLIQWFLA
jgi:UDP-N-acetylglucosamine--dolichyl-phosphate N-acetylglucosaminephosphotransferase